MIVLKIVISSLVFNKLSSDFCLIVTDMGVVMKILACIQGSLHLTFSDNADVFQMLS